MMPLLVGNSPMKLRGTHEMPHVWPSTLEWMATFIGPLTRAKGCHERHRRQRRRCADADTGRSRMDKFKYRRLTRLGSDPRLGEGFAGLDILAAAPTRHCARRPTMTHSTAFWDKVAERYSKKPVADEASYQKKLRVTREYFRPNMEVLEIGCGTGSTAIAHAPFVKHLRATDISAKMIEIAEEKAATGEIENLTFDVSCIDDLNVSDASLDVVLALSVLHLLQNRDEAIAKVHKMLKNDGVFVTSTVCLGDTMKFFKFIGPIGKALGLMPLVRVFTVQELVDSLVEAGFTIDYQWQPGRGTAVFIVAKKADQAPSEIN